MIFKDSDEVGVRLVSALLRDVRYGQICVFEQRTGFFHAHYLYQFDRGFACDVLYAQVQVSSGAAGEFGKSFHGERRVADVRFYVVNDREQKCFIVRLYIVCGVYETFNFVFKSFTS